MSSSAAGAQAENYPVELGRRPVPMLNLQDPNESLQLSAAEDIRNLDLRKSMTSSLPSTKIRAAPELPLLSPSTQVTIQWQKE